MSVERVLAAGIAGVGGAAMGSFLNVVIHRVPVGGSVVRPPSECPSCHARISPRDNVPVLSYALLRGRCRSCDTPIPVRYPIVEIVTAALCVAAFVRYGVSEPAFFLAAASGVLVVLAAIDIDHRRVPNNIVLPATGIGAVWVIAVAFAQQRPQLALDALGSAAACFAVLFVIAAVSGGMGFGDVKLAAFVGLVAGRFGWPSAALAMFAAIVAGGLVGLVMLARGSGRKAAMPFAPMLAIGGLVGAFAGQSPVREWMGI